MLKLQVYMCMYMYACVYTHTHIYIYRERERDAHTHALTPQKSSHNNLTLYMTEQRVHTVQYTVLANINMCHVICSKWFVVVYLVYACMYVCMYVCM